MASIRLNALISLDLCCVLLVVLVSVLSASTSASSPLPTIVEHPTSWINDNSNFTGGVPFSTTASIHSPQGVAKFTCKGSGEQPISYRWFAFPAKDNRLPPRPLSENTTGYWASGPVLIVNQTEKMIIICEASNRFGSVISRSALLSSVSGDSYHLNVVSNTSGFPFSILSCSDEYNYRTQRSAGGYISYYLGGEAYKYTLQYFQPSREAFTNLDSAINEKIESFSFIKGPFAVIRPDQIDMNRTRNLRGTITYRCLKQWDAAFIIKKNETDPDGPPTSLPFVTKFTELTSTSVAVERVRLHLLYAGSRSYKLREQYQVGDDFELICLAAMPSKDSALIRWIHGLKIITDDEEQRIHVASFQFGAILKIKKLRMSDTGAYACQALSTSSRSPVAFITIGINPYQPITFPAQKRVKTMKNVDGSPLTLSCHFDASNKIRRRGVTWLHNGRVLKRSPVIGSSRTALQIPVLDAFLHEGMYQCMVQEDPIFPRNIFNPNKHIPMVNEISGAPVNENYAIHTVAHVEISPVNKYPPAIQSQHGSIVTFDVKSPNLSITTLIISDKDQGSGGRIRRCSVKCPFPPGPCPVLRFQNRLSVHNISDSLLIGTLAFKSLLDQKQATIKVIVNCSDSGKPSLSTALALQVHLCSSSKDEDCLRNSQQGEDNTERTRQLVELARADVAQMNTSDLQVHMRLLEKATESGAEAMSSFDQSLAVESLDAVVDHLEGAPSPSSTASLMDSITRTIDNMQRAPEAVLRRGQRLFGAARRLLRDVDRVTRLCPTNRSWRAPGLVLGAGSVARTSSGFLRFTVDSVAGNVTAVAIESLPEGADAAGNSSISIAVSAKALQHGRVDFSLFAEAWLFDAMLSRPQAMENRRLLSPVIAARALLASGSLVDEEPVTLTFAHAPVPAHGATLSCVFWNFTMEAWDPSGCRLLPEAADNGTVCKCGHLTNFALLLAVDRTPVDPSHTPAVRVLSIVCLVVSCIGLVLTIVIYSSFLRQEMKAVRGGRKMSRTTITASSILVCLCCALLAGHVTFLAGGQHQQDDAGCKVVGVLLHTFYLAAFAWSVVEGVNIFVSLVFFSLRQNQMQTRISRFFLKASIAAWTAPAVIVIVTVAVSPDNYGIIMSGSSGDTPTGGLCFLKTFPFYLAFLMPFLLCLVVNIVIAVMLAVVLKRQGKRQVRDQNAASARKQIIGFVGVCLLLNVTWILGTVQVGVAQLAFMYLFIVINGLQGVFIFVFHCLIRAEARRHLFALLCLDRIQSVMSSRKPPESGTEVSTGSTNLSSRAAAADVIRRPSGPDGTIELAAQAYDEAKAANEMDGSDDKMTSRDEKVMSQDHEELLEGELAACHEIEFITVDL